MSEAEGEGAPYPASVGVWAETARVQPREYVIPKRGTDSSDDIPTIPDLDDFQDILEKEISKPPVIGGTDSETINTLAAVGGEPIAAEGADAALLLLKGNIPAVEMDTADTVWTVDSLLTQLVNGQ